MFSNDNIVIVRTKTSTDTADGKQMERYYNLTHWPRSDRAVTAPSRGPYITYDRNTESCLWLICIVWGNNVTPTDGKEHHSAIAFGLSMF